MKDFDWHKHINACMESTDYCCIATVDPEGTWSNPVYFAWDEGFNIYFISQMHSRHMQNLQKDSRISVSIYRTNQKDDVCGIQLEGKATILIDGLERDAAFRIYHERTGGGKDVEHYINNPLWIHVKITPKQLYYFDTRFFGEERQTVPSRLLH